MTCTCTYTRVGTRGRASARARARVRTYTCRDDELDRVIVPLATGGVVGTIKACVPGVKTCKDALYKVPARRRRPAALPRILPPSPSPLEMRHSSSREYRVRTRPRHPVHPSPTRPPSPLPRFPIPRVGGFSGRRQRPPGVLPRIWVNPWIFLLHPQRFSFSFSPPRSSGERSPTAVDTAD